MKKQQKVNRFEGNLMNCFMGVNSTEPVIGKGMTELMYTDRRTYEVVSVNETGTEVQVQSYNAKMIGGAYSNQYEYKELKPQIKTLVWRNNAWRWKLGRVCLLTGIDYKSLDQSVLVDERGEWKLVDGISKMKYTYPKTRVIFGMLDEYYDYSF